MILLFYVFYACYDISAPQKKSILNDAKKNHIMHEKTRKNIRQKKYDTGKYK